MQRVWTTLGSGTAIDLQNMLILTKQNQMKNCRIWGTENPSRIHWKADAPKTNHFLVRILVQRDNWAIFLRRTNMVVYTLEQRWEILRQIDLQKMAILAKNKNHLFRWSSFRSWQNCRIWGHRKPSSKHWKADAPKTNHCLVRMPWTDFPICCSQLKLDSKLWRSWIKETLATWELWKDES